jgi:plastocyanin
VLPDDRQGQPEVRGETERGEVHGAQGGAAFVGTLPSCCDSCTAGSCAEATTTTTAPGATTTTTLARPQTHTVMVGEGGALVFTPATLTIHVGDTMRWVWGSPGHSVVSGTNGNADNRFCSPSDTGCDNPPLSNMGATYEHTFVQGGTSASPSGGPS